MPARLILLALLLCGAAPADLAWSPHPGASVPLGQRFTDDDGRAVTLGALTGVPAVLALGYFHCPTLCGPVRGDVVAALEASGLSAGRDYRLLVMSIDPAETAADAAEAERADLREAGPAASGADWHYLAGDAAAVAAAVGFPYAWDDALHQFAHPAGVVVLTGTGVVSAYLEGAGFSGAVLRTALLRAASGEVAPLPSPLLLLCFHYDAATGRYTLAIEQVLKVMGVMTVLGIAGLVLVLARRQRVR